MSRDNKPTFQLLLVGALWTVYILILGVLSQLCSTCTCACPFVHNYDNLHADIDACYYFNCCRTGKYLGNTKPRKTAEKRPHQKETRKLNNTCISRMYVDELKHGEITVKYISAHTGHNLGPQEFKYLPYLRARKRKYQ